MFKSLPVFYDLISKHSHSVWYSKGKVTWYSSIHHTDSCIVKKIILG